MTSVSDHDVLAQLTHNGLSLDSYSLLGAEKLTALWHPNNGLMVTAIDNNELATAGRQLLARRGIREFQTLLDVLESARCEKWPNWEKFHAHPS